jgi:hypothetical protein
VVLWIQPETIMDDSYSAVTFEDLHGEVFEDEVYKDAVDKEECDTHCYFSYMGIHRMLCPLYSGIDRRATDRAYAIIDRALGK